MWSPNGLLTHQTETPRTAWGANEPTVPPATPRLSSVRQNGEDGVLTSLQGHREVRLRHVQEPAGGSGGC